MKKTFILAALAALSLTACNNSTDNPAETTAPAGTAPAETITAADAGTDPAEATSAAGPAAAGTTSAAGSTAANTTAASAAQSAGSTTPADADGNPPAAEQTAAAQTTTAAPATTVREEQPKEVSSVQAAPQGELSSIRVKNIEGVWMFSEHYGLRIYDCTDLSGSFSFSYSESAGVQDPESNESAEDKCFTAEGTVKVEQGTDSSGKQRYYYNLYDEKSELFLSLDAENSKSGADGITAVTCVYYAGFSGVTGEGPIGEWQQLPSLQSNNID